MTSTPGNDPNKNKEAFVVDGIYEPINDDAFLNQLNQSNPGTVLQKVQDKINWMQQLQGQGTSLVTANPVTTPIYSFESLTTGSGNGKTSSIAATKLELSTLKPQADGGFEIDQDDLMQKLQIDNRFEIKDIITSSGSVVQANDGTTKWHFSDIAAGDTLAVTALVQNKTTGDLVTRDLFIKGHFQSNPTINVFGSLPVIEDKGAQNLGLEPEQFARATGGSGSTTTLEFAISDLPDAVQGDCYSKDLPAKRQSRSTKSIRLIVFKTCILSRPQIELGRPSSRSLSTNTLLLSRAQQHFRLALHNKP